VSGAAAGPAAGPLPPVPGWPRYTDLPFPPYRFVPGASPHPVVDPRGHSFGRRPEPAPPWDPGHWRELTAYLYAVDLYNYSYWWECHEALEVLWHAAGRKGPAASFLQGIIHVAAANLNRHRRKSEGAQRQAGKALARLEEVLRTESVYMGLEVPAFARQVREHFFSGVRPIPPLIELR